MNQCCRMTTGQQAITKGVTKMNNKELAIITTLTNGKTTSIELKNGCVLKNVSGREFANALLTTLDPDQHFNLPNAVASCACVLMKDCMSEYALDSSDFPREDFQMFGALYVGYITGMVSAMNHASGVNYHHYTELFCEKVYDLCDEYLEKGYCTYHKI